MHGEKPDADRSKTFDPCSIRFSMPNWASAA